MAITPLKLEFGRFLQNCIKGKGIKQAEIATELGISVSAVSQMMKGKIIPNQQQLDRICDLSHFSRAKISELNSMLANIRTGFKERRSPFNQLFFSLRCQRELSLQQLANLSGIPTENLRVFETCYDAYPTPEEIEILAAILECDPDSFLRVSGIGRFYSGKNKNSTSSTIPMLELFDLDQYKPEKALIDYAQHKASKTFELLSNINVTNLVAIQAPSRDLFLGFPGNVVLIVADEFSSPEHKLNFVKESTGKYFIQEVQKDRTRVFKLAGIRKEIGTVEWMIPVVELSIRNWE